ncbi:MAG: SDR family oxidoreductase [Verrucomicrobiales bacterium]|nr:SDR family oxidoreductase [Verrucomicrobiales bacterium]
MNSFKNKVVVITGGASGIGRALAQQLAREGARLAIADVDEACLNETERELTERGGEVYGQCLDVADREAVYDFSERVIGHYGAVDVVINNAGMVMDAVGVEKLAYADFERVMDVNLWGVVNSSKAFLPHLLKRSEASLVNVSSAYGLCAMPMQTAYSTSKFAVRGFTEAIRQELRDTPVKVMVVFPGGVKTNLVRNMLLVGEEGDAMDLDQMSAQLEKSVKTTAAEAAGVIIDGIKKKATRVLIGDDARFMDQVVRKHPGKYGVMLQQRKRR